MPSVSSQTGAGRARGASSQMTFDVGPDVGGLAIVCAIHAKGAFVFQRLKWLHKITMLQVSNWILNEPHCWISFSDDFEHGVSDGIGVLQVALSSGGLGW